MTKRVALVLLVLVLAGAAAGCASGKSGGSGNASGTGGSGSSSVESTTEVAADYPAIPAESPNEKSAVASVDKAMKQQAESQKLGNKQNGTNNYVFDNAPGFKPKFIGYQVVLDTGKKANGKYGRIELAVLGDKVTHMTQWDKAAGVTRDNGMMSPAGFNLEYGSDPGVYTRSYAPVSAGEKAAVSLTEAWMKANVADLGFKTVKLTGYAFAYGTPKDRPGLFILISADGGATVSTGSWPEGYKP